MINKLAWFSWLPIILGALLVSLNISSAGVYLWGSGVALQFVIGITFLYGRFVSKRLQ